MLTRIFLPFLCLLVAGVLGAPVDVSKEAGPFVQGKPQISVVRYSVSPDSNGIPKATKPRQRTREKQFYSPHPLPDLLRESQVIDHSTFGQKKRATTPTKEAGKHSFYIVTPNVNVKRNVSPDLSSTSSSEGSSVVNTHSSVEVSTFLENHNTNAQSPSYALKQVSNRYEFPLSSSEDIFTDSGSLSTLGSLGLLSNDAAGGDHSGNSFGIPIPPINSDSQTFTAIPTDIAALNSLSSQDLTSLNNLSPQEITSLTKSLLDNLNIDSKDLNGLLNLDVTHLESSAASPTGISTDHTKSFGVLLPGLGSQVSTDSSSQSFGVPLPGGSSQTSTDHSGQGQSFGVSLSEANSHGSDDNAGQRQSTGVSLSEANSHGRTDNSGQSQSFGVSLSEANSHGSTDNSGQSQSFGVSLSEANSHGSTDNSGQSQSFGVSLSEANSHRSHDNSGQSQPFGVSLVEANSHGSPDNSGHDQSFGVSLSQANSHGSTENSGQSQSVGVSLAEANSHLSSSDKSGLSQSFGISLSDANSHSSSDNSGQSQSFGVPLPRQSHASSGNSDASQSHGIHSTGIPLPTINQDTSSSSSFDVGQNSVTGNGDSISQASGQSHSFGIALPGLSSSSPSDGLGQSKSVGIPLPGINPDDSGNNFHTPLTVVSEGSSQFSLTKNGNNAILSSSSSSKLSPVFIGGTDDSGENVVTVNVNANGGNTGIPLPGLGGGSSPIDNLTIGQLLMGINGQNGIMVLPMSSLNDLKNGGTNGLTIVTDSSSEADEKVVVNLSSSATTTAAPETTTRRRRTTTTTKAPDTFRVTLSDLLYSKGQWLGTLLGGMFDYGRIAWNAVQDHLDATAQPVYGYPQPVYGSYASNPQPVYG